MMDPGELAGAGGIAKRYGFQDETTGHVLLQLAERVRCPSSRWHTFPTTIFAAIRRGLPEAFSSVEGVDEVLGK